MTGLVDAIKFIDTVPEINVTGIRNVLENIVVPNGAKPVFEGTEPKIYRAIAEFYFNMHPQLNQVGALMQLQKIRGEYM